MSEWEIDVRRGRGLLTAVPVSSAPGRMTTLLCHGGSNAGALFRCRDGMQSSWDLVPYEQLRPEGELLLSSDGSGYAHTPDVYLTQYRIRTPGIYTCFNDTVSFSLTAPSREHTDLVVFIQPVIFEVFDDERAPREIVDGSVSPPAVMWDRRSRQLYPNGSLFAPSSKYRYTFEPDRPQE